MSRVRDFKLPDLGEGLTEGEILQWLVKVGDTVTLNQPIVEVETAKAAVEVPSPFAGVVTALHAEAGQTVDVGAVLITFDTDPGAGDLPAPEEPAATATADAFGPEHGALIGEVGPGGRTATLVGYGPKTGTATRRPRVDVPAPTVSVEVPPPPATAARVSAAAVGQAAAQSAGDVTVLAKPPVRKLAKELGVDLTSVLGTGEGGVITRADVEAAAGSAPAARPAVALDANRERRIPVKGVRKMMAQAMAESAFTAPHVTEFLTLDVTPSMELLQTLKAMPDFEGVKVTPLLLVAKALLIAVKRNPEVNSTFTDEEVVVKDYVHLGIAAATPRGLVVPNIKDADRLSLPELARALQELAETARAGRTSPADMQNGTITITNVGVFGVDTGTPIINPGESAILAFGAVRPTPWVVDGEVRVRQVTTLALSFDHRHVDGQLGSQFLADLGRVLAEPATALVWG
ncbi:MAG TPA: dihydrolipoamide acetyltransferase family protein [Mycobacteriales bacterium]|jgi:pyruvate dehydrogenase E2 component (dihydrolipoamide acetyltransferase)|nr:dihydrolipoamide acetyltransferase family protein [Mycobacteriales bacterium]